MYLFIVCVWWQTTVSVYGGQRAIFKSQVFSFPMWVLEVERRLSGLAAGTFTH